MTTQRMTKHEGLGNDFLVLLDQEASSGDDLSAQRVRHVCDRRRGVGADGLIRARRPGNETSSRVDVVMDLYNADGSRAEMSGNGIRCLAQALLLEGWVTGPEVVIATDAGVRTVTVVDGPSEVPGEGTEHRFEVDMGVVEVSDAEGWALGPTYRAAWASAGNPHLVLELSGMASVERFDLAAHGEKVDTEVADGANVHVIGPGSTPDGITLRTYERGVGLTEACGTGASVAAVVAAGWKLVEPGSSGAVEVGMPGGSASVILGFDGDGHSAVLVGPARSIAAVEIPWL